MEADARLKELEAERDSLIQEFSGPDRDRDPEGRALRLQELRAEIMEQEEKVYFTLDDLEFPKLDGLDGAGLRSILDELKRRYAVVHRVLSRDSALESHVESLADIRTQAADVSTALERWNAKHYEPGPSDAPGYEPSGASARAGFVKTNPANNDFYVEQFRDHPWYPAISQAHEQLSRLVPGYNISQIKEKFGGLRYYFDFPEEFPANPDDRSWLRPEALRDSARAIITWAEGWVDGYEHARREAAAKAEESNPSD